MSRQTSNPPYFDVLLQRIATGDRDAVTAFGQHVHWGYWDPPESASGTSADYHEAAERLCRQICDAAEMQDGQRVVDVGCGFGGTIASLNDRFDRMSMTGINIDARQLQRAGQIVQAGGKNEIDWVEADAAELPIADNSCDRVLAVECVFHFDRSRFLAEAARVLRTGGRLTLSDFVPDQRTVDFMGETNVAGGEAIEWTYGKVDMNCTLSRYRQLAQQSGLKLVAATDITQQTLPTYDYLLQRAGQWHDRDHAELFLKATGWLAKASRKGMIGYQIISFEV